MQTLRSYLDELRVSVGTGWNRFWFTPADPVAVCALRVLVGFAAVYFLISHAADLVVWFGRDGLLPIDTVHELVASAPDGSPGFRWSYLFYTDSPSLLWALHWLGLIVALAFALGLFTRITAVLTLVTVLAYVHRAPMITGPFEPILTMLLYYLCLAPCGAVLSLDRFIARVRAARVPAVDRPLSARGDASLAANISVRMMQVHVTALYLMMGLTKLAGETWWRGDAVWWLAASTESRLLDLTFLHRYPLLINLWTHCIVAFELLFAVLIWNRLARPLLLGISLVMWLSLAIVTGQVSFCAIMLIANLCFVPPWIWGQIYFFFFREGKPGIPASVIA
ncbi:MAG: HTTM domain-containing protein [Pirellulaceae bacterium]